jgi:precorrin-2 dehydrogenase/sirohydrochlorin ferrochelatase
MDNNYYPIMIKLSYQRIMIVGGGNIAARKVQSLLEAGAQSVTVVAPQLCPALQQHVALGSIVWLNCSYKDSILKSATLIFAATDDVKLNEQISNDALACDILICNVSDGKQGNFITPAVARHKGLTAAISSGGSSPTLVKYIKSELEQHYLPRYEQAQQLLEQLRNDVVSSTLNAKQRQYLLTLAVAEAVTGHTGSYEQWYQDLINRTVQVEGEDIKHGNKDY